MQWGLDASRRAHAKLDCFPEMIAEVNSFDTNAIVYVGLTSASGPARAELDTMSAVAR